MKLGVNLEQLVAESPEMPFCNAMDQAREWQQVGGSSMPQLDAFGWPLSLSPGQTLQTLLFWNLRNNLHFPAGQYDVIYDGSGTLQYQQSGGFVPVTRSPGHDVITLDPAHGGLQLAITHTDPAYYLRNIRVWRPGGDRRHFNQDFLATLQGYKFIRFMWWMHATINRPGNAPFQTSWGARPQLSARTWANDNGVPIEAIIELSNGTNTDPWICPSHLADDDYLRQLAAALNAGMSTGRVTYIESSNEVWNGQYQQSQYATQQGQIMWPGVDPRTANGRWNVTRALHVASIMKPILGARMKMILGSFIAMPGYTSNMLNFIPGHTSSFDGVAIAPYFGFPQGLPSGTTLDQLFSLLPAQVSATLSQCQQQKSVCDAFQLPMMAYEGGPSFASTPNTPPDVDALYTAANRDPRMGDAIQQLLDGWKGIGGSDFCFYSNCGNYNQFGRYGLLEFMTQLNQSAKYAAIQKWLTANP